MNYEVTQKEYALSMREFTETCVDVPKFQKCCRECPQYGKNHACPPLPFDAAGFWGKYRSIRLVMRVITPQGGTAEELLKAVEEEKIKLHRELLAQEKKDSLCIAPGKCMLCPEGCNREKGEKCRGKCRHSLEALGADVGKAAELFFGTKLLWVQDGKMPEYMLVMGALAEDKR